MNIAVYQSSKPTSIPVKVVNGFAYKFIGGENILRLRLRRNMTPEQLKVHEYQMSKFFHLTVECED